VHMPAALSPVPSFTLPVLTSALAADYGEH
jgi:hypothetical protein